MQSIIDDIDTTSLASNAKIKVVGVGGGGGNAVQKMISSDLVGIQFICANTDLQALNSINAPVKIQLGEKLTRGLGAGANPEIGRNSAIESQNAIRDAICEDTDMVFITAGMGGGTGTGAAPVIASIAKEMGALTVGVVTKPFTFEGTKKQRLAEAGIEEFKKFVDSLIIVPNDRLNSIAQKKASFASMLQKANEVLLNAVRGISDVIMREGVINLDFADVRTTMGEMGLAIMGIGKASGENRAREAAHEAIVSPLLEDASLESAKAILYNITANEDITIDEISEIGSMIKEAAKEDINIIFGVVSDKSMGDELQVTVIATGIEPLSEEVETSKAVVTQFDNIKDAAFKAPSSRPQKEPVAREISPTGDIPLARPSRRAVGHGPLYNDPMGGKSHYSPYDSFKMSRPHTPGQDDFTFDDEEFQIPTFIRTQAD